MTYPHAHLLGIEPLSPGDITGILDLAEEYVALNRSEAKHRDVLSGLTQINMFFEASTRTQASFELACPMDLSDFPYDTQACPLVMGMYDSTADEVALEWKGSARAVDWSPTSACSWSFWCP